MPPCNVCIRFLKWQKICTYLPGISSARLRSCMIAELLNDDATSRVRVETQDMTAQHPAVKAEQCQIPIAETEGTEAELVLPLLTAVHPELCWYGVWW